MSTHVLLHLLNELRKRDYLFFATSLINFNNTGAQILDSIYHMTLKMLKNDILM